MVRATVLGKMYCSIHNFSEGDTEGSVSKETASPLRVSMCQGTSIMPPGLSGSSSHAHCWVDAAMLATSCSPEQNPSVSRTSSVFSNNCQYAPTMARSTHRTRSGPVLQWRFQVGAFVWAFGWKGQSHRSLSLSWSSILLFCQCFCFCYLSHSLVNVSTEDRIIREEIP
jgi:hypothetical protein